MEQGLGGVGPKGFLGVDWGILDTIIKAPSLYILYQLLRWSSLSQEGYQC